MPELKRTARITGLLYLGLAISGMLGFLVIRAQLHAPDSPAETLANLTDNEGLARLGIASELAIVLSQAVLAVWFFKLFRTVSAVAAGAIAGFGFVNAAAILASSAALSTALAVALDPSRAPGGDAAATVQMLYSLADGFWAGGAIFFGLWLIPMGYAVLKSGWMPRLIGYFLIAGGIGYVLSALTTPLLPNLKGLTEAFAYPATIGEFWMLGYLVIIGVRNSATADASLAPSFTVTSTRTR